MKSSSVLAVHVDFSSPDFRAKRATLYAVDYTPEYAENPPSIGTTTPVTNPDLSSSESHITVPKSSSASPNLLIGVPASIFCVLAVGLPLLSKSNALF